MAIEWTNETRRLRDLIPWEHNSRQINTKEAERLGDSLVEFGQIQTIAIGPDNEVYDGHQRKAVWSLLPQFGPDHEVDVRVASRALTDKERQKLVVFLHRGTMGEWDWDELANTFEVPDLLEWGFDESELQLDWGKDAADDPGPQLDKAAELQEKWQVKRGQVWQVGRHRVMCGGSTCAEDVGRLMRGERAKLLFTSPPYWVGKEYESQKAESQIDEFITACVKAWTDFVDVDWGRITINTGTAAIHRVEKRRKVEVLPLIDKWQEALRQRGWLARHFRIWAKSGDFPARISARADVVDQHWEHIVTFDSEWSYLGTWWAPTGQQRGQEKIGTPWAQQGLWTDIPGERSAGGTHIAAFPVALPSRNILLYTKRGEPVADFFTGSGTTLVACEQTNRIGYGMEIEPKYVAVTLERLTGMGLEAQVQN